RRRGVAGRADAQGLTPVRGGAGGARARPSPRYSPTRPRHSATPLSPRSARTTALPRAQRRRDSGGPPPGGGRGAGVGEKVRRDLGAAGGRPRSTTSGGGGVGVVHAGLLLAGQVADGGHHPVGDLPAGAARLQVVVAEGEVQGVAEADPDP